LAGINQKASVNDDKVDGKAPGSAVDPGNNTSSQHDVPAGDGYVSYVEVVHAAVHLMLL